MFNNPRKKRRLNNSNASSSSSSSISANSHSVVHSRIERVKQELASANAEKQSALQRYAKLKADSLADMKAKTKQIRDLQGKLKTIHQENEELTQKQSHLSHRLEILEGQLDQPQVSKPKASLLQRNGHHTTTKKKTMDACVQCDKLQRDVQIKDKTIACQNEEIIKLDGQIKLNDRVNMQNVESLETLSKHNKRLQAQLKQKTEMQADIAESGMAAIRESLERKIRLLDSSLHDYKAHNLKLTVIAEDHELLQTQHCELKRKYDQLCKLNATYEPVYKELNEWKQMVRKLSKTLLPPKQHKLCLDNDLQLRQSLTDLNDAYIVLVSQRDEFKCSVTRLQQTLEQTGAKLKQTEAQNSKHLTALSQLESKMKTLHKQLRESSSTCTSYKNILNTYNAMSPSKNNQQQQIDTLHKENASLAAKLSESEGDKSKLERALKAVESEKAHQKHFENNKQEYESQNEQIMHIRENPLAAAMRKHTVAEQGKKTAELEAMILRLKQDLAQKNVTQKARKSLSSLECNRVSCEKLGTDGNTRDHQFFDLENRYNILVSKMSLKDEQVGELERELHSSRKIKQRMKQLFGKKAGEYRERVYQMTGYNICLLGDGKHYRMQHVWMTEESDEIILQINKMGDLQLKDTDFMRHKVDKKLLLELRNGGSMPGFFSKLTLTLNVNKK